MTFILRSEALSAVSAAAWDRLVGVNDPFLTHAFLLGLERTGCVGQGSGWVPRHMMCYKKGVLVGAVPLYEKHHSYGEFVFDFDWAQAAESASIRYYPKLVSAVPFTPATGPRLLVHPEADQSQVCSRLIEHVHQTCKSEGYSSTHVLFAPEPQVATLQASGFISRLGFQFHWDRQPGWQTFDDYLTALKSSVRKQVRKERAKAHSHGLAIEMRAGAELSPQHGEAFWQCYQSTIDKHGSHAYLNREFIDYMFEHLRAHLLLAVASKDGEIMAAALFLHRGKHLYGRYWGSLQPFESLHFELCYYQPIEWAMRHGIEHFEAGAQGLHKLKRGLIPRACHSAHLIVHPGLARAIGEHVQRERLFVQRQIDRLAEHSPYGQIS